MTRDAKRRLAIAGLVAAGVVAAIFVGRWEGDRHAREQNAGMRRVLAAIGPIGSPSAYRAGVGFGMDCLLYRRGENPYALELCFDPQGRIVETIDRRGASPKFSSLREEPSASTIRLDVDELNRLVDRLREKG